MSPQAQPRRRNERPDPFFAGLRSEPALCPHGMKKALPRQCFFSPRPIGFEPTTYRFVAGHSIR